MLEVYAVAGAIIGLVGGLSVGHTWGQVYHHKRNACQCRAADAARATEEPSLPMLGYAVVFTIAVLTAAGFVTAFVYWLRGA